MKLCKEGIQVYVDHKPTLITNDEAIKIKLDHVEELEEGYTLKHFLRMVAAKKDIWSVFSEIHLGPYLEEAESPIRESVDIVSLKITRTLQVLIYGSVKDAVALLDELDFHGVRADGSAALLDDYPIKDLLDLPLDLVAKAELYLNPKNREAMIEMESSATLLDTVRAVFIALYLTEDRRAVENMLIECLEEDSEGGNNLTNPLSDLSDLFPPEFKEMEKDNLERYLSKVRSI